MEIEEQQNKESENTEDVKNSQTDENKDLAYFNNDLKQNNNDPQNTQSSNQTAQPSLLKAILLAVAFGIIGCLAFGILYYFGYIAFVGAYLIFCLACFGYKKFNNGKIDKKGYIIVTVISIVELFITILISLSFAICREIPEVGFMNALSYIPDLMELSPEFKSGLVSDIVVSVLFLFIGLISDIVATKRKAKMNGSV